MIDRRLQRVLSAEQIKDREDADGCMGSSPHVKRYNGLFQCGPRNEPLDVPGAWSDEKAASSAPLAKRIVLSREQLSGPHPLQNHSEILIKVLSGLYFHDRRDPIKGFPAG